MEEKLKRLYENALKYFDLPEYEQFAIDMQDAEKMERLRDNMVEHYDMPPIEQMLQDFGVKKNPSGVPIVPGGPGSPDAPSEFTPEQEDTESPVTPEETEPSSDTGDEVETEEVIEEPIIEEPIIEEPEPSGDFSITIDDVGQVAETRGGYNPQGEKDTLLEREFGYNGFTDFFGDMYRGAKVGAAQADAVDEYLALALKKAEDVTNDDIADYLEALERLESQPESKEMEQFRKTSAANGGGFMGMMVGLMQNFSIAPAVMIQSIRSMANAHSLATGGASALVAGAAAAKASSALSAAAASWTGLGAGAAGLLGGMIGGTTGAIGGFIGGATTALEGALSFGEFFKEAMEKRDLPINAKSVREILEDPEAMSSIRNRAISRGFTIGTVEAVTMGLSKGAVTSIAKVGTQGVKKGILKGTLKGKKAIQASNISAGAAAYSIEAAGGSLGEVLGRVAADQEMDEIDIFLEGIAGTSTAPISLAAGLLKVPRYKVNGDFVTQDFIDGMLKKVEDGGMTMEEFASSDLNVEIKNDPVRKKILTDAKSYAKLGLELDPNITEYVDKKLAIDLEYRKRAIKNPDLETSKRTISQIDLVLKAISDKYNGSLDAQAKQELQKEGVESPTTEQIKEKADAIFKRITETVDVQKLTKRSKTLGTRDESEQETTEQSKEESQAVDESATTEKTEVTDQDAIDALAEEGTLTPSPDVVAEKKKQLQLEVDKLNETTESTTEGPALQRNESTEQTTKTKDGASIKVKVEQVLDNLVNYQGNPITSEVAKRAYNKTVNIAKRAAKSISKILPNTKIVLVEDPVTYQALTGKTNPGTYQVESNTIFVNTQKSTIATIGHEVGHALVIQSLKKGEANITGVTTRMFEALKNSKALNRVMVTLEKDGKKVKQSLSEYLNNFAESYESNLQNEEKLVEAIGVLAGSFGRLDIKEKGLIRRWVDKVLKAAGLGKFVKELTDTDRKVVQFLNTLSGKISSGTEFSTDDLTILKEIEAEIAAEEKSKPKSKKKAPKKKAPKKKAPKKKAPKKKAPAIVKPKVKVPTKKTVRGQQEEELKKQLAINDEILERIEQIENERDGDIAEVQEEISSVKIDLKNDLKQPGLTKIEKLELREDAKATLDDLKFDISQIKAEARKAISEARKEAKSFDFNKPKSVSKMNDRFQANYSDPGSGLQFTYDQNSKKFKLLESLGFITKDRSIKDFNNKQIVFHSPDSAFSGTIKLRNGDVLVEGKGGLNYPIKFHDDGSFWASTEAGADSLVKLLNQSFDTNRGKVYMALTSSPKDKILSSTTMSNAVLDFFNKGVSKLGRGVVESGIKAAASFQKETTFIDPKTQKQKSKLSGLNLDIKENESFSSILEKIKKKLAPDQSTFPDRKVFSEELIRYMAAEINANPELQKRFTSILGEGVQNKYFKGSPVKGTKGAIKKISFANLKSGLTAMLTAPLLKGLQKSGLVYGIVELDSKVEKVKSDQHESYPFSIKAVTKGEKSILNILTDRVKWSDVAIDPSTGTFVAEDKVTSIMPTTRGLSTSGLFINTDQVSSQGEVTLGQGLDSIQDRDQQSFARFIDNYQINEKGFMPSTVFDVGRLRREAKEFGFGVREAKFREGYRRGETAGYYLTKGGKFFNPRARYQMIDSNNAIDVIIDARKNKISDAAIKIKLAADGFTAKQIAAGLENASYFADLSAEVPSSFLLLGDKVGRRVYKRVVDFVRKTNIENGKGGKRLGDRELAIEAERKEAALRKRAKLKSPEQIENDLVKEEKRLKGLKKKLTNDEIEVRLMEKANALNKKEQDKLNKINDTMASFRENQIKRNNKLDPKLTKAEIIDRAIEVLQTDPAYIDAKGKKKGASDLQNLMVDQLLVNLATRATIDVNSKIAEAQKRINKLTKGKKKVNTKKEVFYVQTQLINLIKKSIPAAHFNKKEVQSLLTKVRDVIKPGKDIQESFNSIIAEVSSINNKILFSELRNILTKKYTTTSGGVVRAKQVTGNISDRIKTILKNTLVQENDKLTLEELDERVTELNAQLQDRANKLESEIKSSPENVDALTSELADIELAMEINNSLTMDNNEVRKTESLSEVLENLNSMLIDGNSALKLAKQQAYQQHLENINAAYEAITGERLDLGIKENIEKAEKAISDAKQIKDKSTRRIFVISRVITGITNALSYFRNATSGLSLLMEKIDVLPGELFGGVMQELVYEKINESSYAYKQFQIDDQNMLLDKAVEVFVNKKFLGIKKPTFLQKYQARQALRKMGRPTRTRLNTDTRLGRLAKKLGINSLYKIFSQDVRTDANGNIIYTDQAAVDKAMKEYQNAEGFFNKLRKKALVARVMDANVFDISDAETYYLYNQYKDFRNHINFEKNVRFGKDHARIMKGLEESMSAELKEWADWQTNEMYPALYERYNKVYKKLYNVNLPWNRFYGGRLYLEGVERDAVSLIGKPNIYKSGDTTSASLFSRVHHNNAIEIANGNNVLSTYLTDMNWFAAYGENINQISKMFNNTLIKKAIQVKEGKFFYDTLMKIIDQVAARGIQTTASSKFINLTNDFFLTTRLALTPILTVKQLLSSVTYMGDIGVVNWLKYAGLMSANTLTFGKFGKGLAGASKEIFANSVYMKDRYSAGFQNTLESYNSTKEVSLYDGTRRYTQFLMDFNLFFSKIGDAGAIFLGGIPNYLYHKDQARISNPDATEQQIIDIAIKEFQKDTKQTQQSSDIQDKDIYQLDAGSLRYLNMFKTTPKQYLRKSMYSQLQLGRKISAGVKAMLKGKNPLEIYRIMQETGKGGLAENLRNWFLYHVTMPVSFQYVSMGLPGLLKPEFDDEDINDLARAAVLGNINAVFVVGDLLKSMADLTIGGKKYGENVGLGLPIFELFSMFGRNYNAYQRTKNPDIKELHLIKMMGSIFDIMGLPGSKGTQTAIHLEKISDGKISSNEKMMRALGFSEYIVSKSFKPIVTPPPGLTNKEKREWREKQKKKNKSGDGLTNKQRRKTNKEKRKK